MKEAARGGLRAKLRKTAARVRGGAERESGCESAARRALLGFGSGGSARRKTIARDHGVRENTAPRVSGGAERESGCESAVRRAVARGVSKFGDCSKGGDGRSLFRVFSSPPTSLVVRRSRNFSPISYFFSGAAKSEFFLFSPPHGGAEMGRAEQELEKSGDERRAEMGERDGGV